MQDLGDLVDGTGQSQAYDTNGRVVVGTATSGFDSDSAFLYDLGATSPGMKFLGSPGGHFDRATAIDANLVTGRADQIATTDAHAFAYDLAARTPRIADLGPYSGDFDVCVSGQLAARTIDFTPDLEQQHAVAWSLSTTTAPALRFDRLKTFVKENAGHVTVTVFRDGDLGPAASIRYFTKTGPGPARNRLQAHLRSPVLRTRASTSVVPGADHQRQAPRGPRIIPGRSARPEQGRRARHPESRSGRDPRQRPVTPEARRNVWCKNGRFCGPGRVLLTQPTLLDAEREREGSHRRRGTARCEAWLTCPKSTAGCQRALVLTPLVATAPWFGSGTSRCW